MIIHISIKLKSRYDAFTAAFEQAIVNLDLPSLQKAGHEPHALEAAIQAMQGQEGMSLFSTDNL